MTKVLSVVLILAMAVQLIRPLGLPGLRKRADFWKIAVLALFIIGLTATLQPQ